MVLECYFTYSIQGKLCLSDTRTGYGGCQVCGRRQSGKKLGARMWRTYELLKVLNVYLE